MKKIFITILIIICSKQIFAQKDPIKWKKIPIEDLQMSTYEDDSLASAVVLCDYGQYYFDTNPNGDNLFFFQERHVRIKILKKEGLKYAKIRIPYIDMTYEKFPQENSIIIKGMSYKLSNGNKLDFVKLRQRDITHKDSIRGIKIAEFRLPEVEVGSVIDYYYKKASLDFVNLPDWQFQYEIPVKHSELRFYIPRYFKYACLPVNFDNFDLVNENYYSRSLLLRDKNRNSYNYNRVFNYDFGGKKLQFVKQNNPAITHENFVINEKNNSSHLKIHLVEAINENHGYLWERYTHALYATTIEGYEEYQPIQRKNIFYPAAYIIYRLHDWETVNKELLESSQFGLPMIKHWNYKAHLDSIIKGKTSDFEKMHAIYNYVRKNIKWNGINSIYVKSVFNPDLSKLYTRITRKMIKEKSLQRPFDAKQGSSSEINMILISLLNKAGIKTNAVLLSRRDNAGINKEIADPTQFNNVIALAKIGDNNYLLDATNPHRPYNILDKNQLVNNAFLVDGKDFGWIETKNIEKTYSKSSDNIVIADDFKWTRSIKLKFTGYDAIKRREEIIENGKMNENLSNLQIDSIKNLHNDDKNLIIVTKIQNGQSTTNKLNLHLKLNSKYNAKDFNQFVRNSNIEFEYPYEQVYNFSITIPKNYTCSLPKNVAFQIYGNKAYFHYTTKQIDTKITISVKVGITTNSFPAREYDNLRQLFTLVNNKLQEEIIIVKNNI